MCSLLKNIKTWVQLFRYLPEVQGLYTPENSCFLYKTIETIFNSGFLGFLIFLTCIHVKVTDQFIDPKIEYKYLLL
jgi:hypothetical protein